MDGHASTIPFVQKLKYHSCRIYTPISAEATRPSVQQSAKDAAERIRTSTPLSEHGHLKPGRLPVPPQPRAGLNCSVGGAGLSHWYRPQVLGPMASGRVTRAAIEFAPESATKEQRCRTRYRPSPMTTQPSSLTSTRPPCACITTSIIRPT